jgi:uncharacterized protein DUF3618
MGQGTRDLRREVEDARERLAEDMQALAYQMNVPRRMREKIDDSVISARRRMSLQNDASMAREALWDIRHGRRSEGLRKLGSAALAPAVIALAVGAAAVVASRLRDDRTRRDHHDHVHSNGRAGHKGAVMSAIVRSGVTAAAHQRHARKHGRAPGLKHFAAYAVVGAGTSAATKWLNDRIDLTAQKIS